jgi:hypothetical protein
MVNIVLLHCMIINTVKHMLLHNNSRMALCSKHAATLPHFTLTNQLGLKLRLIVYTQVLITLSLKYNMNEIACNYYVAVECHNITFLHSINLSIS